MSEPAENLDVFALGHEAKDARRRELVLALTGESEGEPEQNPLDVLADKVAERLLARIVDQVREPEGFFAGAQRTRREHAAALVDALTARR